jgi:hypothetical protein
VLRSFQSQMTNREQLWLIRMVNTVQASVSSVSSSHTLTSWGAADILCDHFTSLPSSSTSKTTWMKALGPKIIDWPKEQWKSFVIHLAKMLFAFGTKTPLSTQVHTLAAYLFASSFIPILAIQLHVLTTCCVCIDHFMNVRLF